MKIRFVTVSGSTYIVDQDEGTVHRTNVKTLRGADGELIPGSGWKLDKAALILPTGMIAWVVGLDKPIITTPIAELEVMP
jgi:hypothetical protein